MESAIREITIHSLGELVEAVTPEHPDRDSGRLRQRTVYRGVAVPAHALLTSLDRLGTPERPPHAKGHLEEHLLRNFIRYSRPHLEVPPSSDWEYLVIAQHHGLPTRLLDWAHSPLVAAHFATILGEPGTDRVVWALDWGRMHDHFGFPPVALMVEELDRELQNKQVESVWGLFRLGPHVPQSFAVLMEPPALDARIVAQSAAFTICSDRTRTIDAVLVEAGLADCLTRCILPASSVERVRDQLDLCGVDERRLFLDLDGVTAQMRRYYAPSSRREPPFPTHER